MTLLVKRLHPNAVLPSYSKMHDAGLDIHALEDFTINPRQTIVVPAGIAIAIPPGYFGSARERSGLAVQGIRLGGGVIDSGYRGEVKGILTNTGVLVFKGKKWDRIFQIIIQPYSRMEPSFVSELPESERGDAGFGSSGR